MQTDNVGMYALHLPRILILSYAYLLRPHHNLYSRANLIHPQLIETTTTLYPRKGWSEHFARVIEKELSLKPWCHTSTFEIANWKEGVRSNFATDVRGNEVMKKYD